MTSKTRVAAEFSSAHGPTPKVNHWPVIYDSNIHFISYSDRIGTNLHNYIFFNSYTYTSRTAQSTCMQFAITLTSGYTCARS